MSGPRLSPRTGTVAWVGFSDARQRTRPRFCVGPDARDGPSTNAQNSVGASRRLLVEAQELLCAPRTAKNAAQGLSGAAAGAQRQDKPYGRAFRGGGSIGKRVDDPWSGTRSDSGARCTRVRCYSHRSVLVDRQLVDLRSRSAAAIVLACDTTPNVAQLKLRAKGPRRYSYGNLERSSRMIG